MTQLNQHRLDADAGTPRVLNAVQQTAGLVEEGVKLFDQLEEINMTADSQRHFAPVP